MPKEMPLNTCVCCSSAMSVKVAALGTARKPCGWWVRVGIRDQQFRTDNVRLGCKHQASGLALSLSLVQYSQGEGWHEDTSKGGLVP